MAIKPLLRKFSAVCSNDPKKCLLRGATFVTWRPRSRNVRAKISHFMYCLTACQQQHYRQRQRQREHYPTPKPTTCAHCGKELEQGGKGRPRMYCPDGVCRRAHWEQGQSAGAQARRVGHAAYEKAYTEALRDTAHENAAAAAAGVKAKAGEIVAEDQERAVQEDAARAAQETQDRLTEERALRDRTTRETEEAEAARQREAEEAVQRKREAEEAARQRAAEEAERKRLYGRYGNIDDWRRMVSRLVGAFDAVKVDRKGNPADPEVWDRLRRFYASVDPTARAAEGVQRKLASMDPRRRQELESLAVLEDGARVA